MKQSWFIQKINKINKPLSQHDKKKQTPINKIRDEKEDITTNTREIQKIIRKYFENLYSSKPKNLDKMDKFLDACNQSKLNQKDVNHLNSPISCNEN
jgi:ubiquinone biosynthesis protein Coq4